MAETKLGLYLKAKRKELAWTQEDLAHALRMSVVSITWWENGIVTPSAESLHKLAKVFNVDIREITKLL